MAKKISTTSDKKRLTFSELNLALSEFSPDGSILEDSVFARIDEWIPTGNYILNAALSGSLFGGMPNRRSLTFAGEEGTGKTYLALSIVRHAQAMDYDVVYYDSEGAIDIDFVKRLGVDTRRIRIENISTIEEFATNTAKLNEIITNARNAGITPPKIMVVLDSLGNLSSIKEKADTTSGDNKRDMTKQQSIRRTFRVVGNDFAKNAIPFIICNHVYEKVGSYIPGKEVSGGGGIKYNSSIIMMLTKSKLEDKEADDKNKKNGIDAPKVGIVITCSPFKQRFARPIKVQMHLPFYKKPNPFVGLEKFLSWENCGVVRGKMLNEKEYSKLSEKEQESCYPFNTKAGKMYAQPKETARTLVCKHTESELPLIELYTEKVFTQEVLQLLDNNIIKKTFMLPSIESLEDLADLTSELDVDEIDEYSLGDIVINDDIQEDE